MYALLQGDSLMPTASSCDNFYLVKMIAGSTKSVSTVLPVHSELRVGDGT